MFNIDEKLLKADKALINICCYDGEIDKMLKAGTIYYVTESNELKLITPETKNLGILNTILTANKDNIVKGSFSFDDVIRFKNGIIVDGKVTEIEKETLKVKDPIIDINRDNPVSGTPTKFAGLAIHDCFNTKDIISYIGIKSAVDSKGFVLNWNDIEKFFYDIDKDILKINGTIKCDGIDVENLSLLSLSSESISVLKDIKSEKVVSNLITTKKILCSENAQFDGTVSFNNNVGMTSVMVSGPSSLDSVNVAKDAYIGGSIRCMDKGVFDTLSAKSLSILNEAIFNSITSKTASFGSTNSEILNSSEVRAKKIVVDEELIINGLITNNKVKANTASFMTLKTESADIDNIVSSSLKLVELLANDIFSDRLSFNMEGRELLLFGQNAIGFTKDTLTIDTKSIDINNNLLIDLNTSTLKSKEFNIESDVLNLPMNTKICGNDIAVNKCATITTKGLMSNIDKMYMDSIKEMIKPGISKISNGKECAASFYSSGNKYFSFNGDENSTVDMYIDGTVYVNSCDEIATKKDIPAVYIEPKAPSLKDKDIWLKPASAITTRYDNFNLRYDCKSVLVKILWDINDFSKVALIRNEDRVPINYKDGVKIYEGPEKCYIDSNIDKSKNYYYAIFGIKDNGDVCTVNNQSLFIMPYAETFNVPIKNITYSINNGLLNIKFSHDNYDKIRVVKNKTHMPENLFDGDTFDLNQCQFNDYDIYPGNNYYYRFFPFINKKEYCADISQCLKVCI